MYFKIIHLLKTRKYQFNSEYQIHKIVNNLLLNNFLILYETLFNRKRGNSSIIAVSEAWIYQNELNYIYLNEYNGYFNSRVQKRGGGVAWFVKDHINLSNIT